VSLELLRALQERHAFNTTPPESSLAALHVPFDLLTEQTGCEQALSDAMRRGERIALIGPSGSGKSSVTAHVLDRWVPLVAPIRVRVGMESADVATDPAAFTRHLVRTVAKYIEQHDPARADARQASRAVSAAYGIADDKRPTRLSIAPQVGWLGVELAAELGAVIRQVPPSGQDVLEQAQLILQVITDRGLRPGLVLDDTDHWLNLAGLPSTEQVRAGFFGRVVRLIAEQFPLATAVIAVHDSYLADPAYLAAAEFLEATVELPAVPSAAGFGLILQHRARLALGAEIPIADIVEDAALSRLFENYQATDRSLRSRLLQVAHGALAHACDVGADRLGPVHVEQSIAE
jgi:hypothetical protein